MQCAVPRITTLGRRLVSGKCIVWSALCRALCSVYYHTPTAMAGYVVRITQAAQRR